MKRNIAYISLGLLAYASFLVISFPAERVFALLQEKVPVVRVAGVGGTAWSGHAAELQVKNQSLRRLKWQFNPWGLFLARLEFDLSFDDETRKGKATVGLRPDGVLVMTDIDMQIPMAEIGQFLNLDPMLRSVEFGGLLELQLAELSISGSSIQSAEGTVYWRGAGVIQPLTQNLGEYVAQLTNEEGGVSALFKDEGGPLQLDGNFKLSPDGTYHISANVAVRDQQQKMLSQGLQSFAQRGPDGRYIIEYDGHL